MQELTANTTYQWVTNYKGSGINGGTFTATNGAVLFIPAAGYCNFGSQYGVGNYGYYWGSSPGGSGGACSLYFGNGGKDVYDARRERGCSVRGVLDETPSKLHKVAVTGNYNDLENKPTIPAAVAVKGDAETNYRTGNVNITPANIGLGNVGNFKAVSTAASQGLTATEQANARTNISAIGQIINTTWADLKSLRDNSQLVPGQWYRITDYECTTTQENTQSAGHQFDIIVRADDVNVLNENAYAALHSGDAYFTNAGAKLESWELKYCLDNDTTKFAWVDSANGKGVVWWMKDESDNECHYDFKNMQFKFASGREQSGILGNVFYYTFSVATGTNDATITDNSLNGFWCNNNRIGKWIENSTRRLNFNVFRNKDTIKSCHSNTFGDSCSYNTFGNYCHSNTFGNSCRSNTFWNGCYNNTFGNGCSSNTFRDSCYSNTFGNYFQNNTFGNYCQKNTFGNDCQKNTFGNDCHSNTFGNYCHYNTFGKLCQKNTFGNDCHSNTFGNDCHTNTFGNSCLFNTFGDSCYSNTFGNSCHSNTFGNYCHSNTFGDSCEFNTFGDNENIKSYCRFIIVENGNQRLNINCSATTSLSKFFQNIKISQGVNNNDRITVSITHPTAGDVFQTEYKPENSVTVSVANGEYGESSSNAVSDII
jgi:hypothetical protein